MLNDGDETTLDAADQNGADAAGPPPISTIGSTTLGHANAVAAGLSKAEGLPSIPGFQVIGKLGEGGMGVVWKAAQLSTKRLVALKLMSAASFGSDRARHRFEREVELTAKLDHPHIARVYDSGLLQGVCYYAMELIDGKRLDQYVKGKKLSRIEIIELMKVICRAVQYAHQKGIIHRDLKPSNILVDNEGHPHVMDFGLAKGLESDQHLSVDGDVAGTPAYMSPEQAAGKFDALDTRSDVYTLGVILFHLLCGKFPHNVSGSSLEVMRRISQEEPKRLKEIEPRADRELEVLLSKALEREPERRYGSAGELADDLDRYLKHEPLNAQPPTVRYVVGKKLRKYRVPIAIAAGVCLVLLMTGVWAYVRVAGERNSALEANSEKDRQRQAAEQARQLADQMGERNGKLAADNGALAEQKGSLADHLRHTLSETDARTGHLLMEQSRDDEALAYEARALEENPSNQAAVGDSVALIYRHHAPLLLLRHDYPVEFAAFSPDGKRVVTASGTVHEGFAKWRGEAQVWDAATGKPLGEPIRPHLLMLKSVAFTPDSSRVVTASYDNTVCLWDAATGKPLGEPMRHRDEVLSAAFTPDGAHVVTASKDNTARVWDAVTGKLLRSYVNSCAFSPDGTRTLTASSDNMWRVCDAASGKPLGEPMQIGPGATSVAFSPDGMRVVAGIDHRAAQVWDAATGKPLGEPMRHGDVFVFSAVVSPDGTRVLTSSGAGAGQEFGEAQVWDAATGKPLGEPLRHEGYVFSVAFSHDGTRVVTAGSDKTARVWDAATGKPLGEPMRHEHSVNSAAFSPDGTRVVTACADKTARVWDLAQGSPLREPMRYARDVTSAAFSRDGTRVFTGCRRQTRATARVWDAATGKLLGEVGEPIGHNEWEYGGPASSVFSPDGTRVVSTNSTLEGINTSVDVQVRDATTGKPLWAPTQPQSTVISAAFSPDGTRVVFGSVDGMMRVLDAATGKLLGEPIRNPAVGPAPFSPDGTRLVLCHSLILG